MLIHSAHILCVFVLVDISLTQDADKNPLVKLLELQIDHCTAASFCTFNARDDNSPPQNESCCYACSCEAECTLHGTCCPDYHLLDTIGREVSYSISDFSDRLTNVNVKTDSRLTCVEASMPTRRKIHEISEVSYKMINSCPDGFSGNSDILNKCNDPDDAISFEYDLFIPVTSLKSGTTYRNMYCFFCNEELLERTDAAIWTSTFFCRNSHHDDFIQATPYEFFTSTIVGNVYPCHVVFSPDTLIGSDFVAGKCDIMVHIETCPDGSEKQLDEICNSFNLPVGFFNNPWTYKRYKNIACFLCNVEKPFNPVCNIEHFIFRSYGIDLNIQTNENNVVVHTDELEEAVLNVDVIKKEDNECETGFIRNSSIENTCTRVLCPWNFYIHDGNCIPTFTRLHSLRFSALIEVRRAEIFGLVMLEEIRKNYMKKIETIASTMFRHFAYGLYEKENDYDLLAVSFTVDEENYNYLAMLNQYVAFLDKICILTINAKSSAVKVSSFQSRSPWQDSEMIIFMVPRPTQIRKFEIPESLSSFQVMEIYISHLCYRATVPNSERDFYINNHYIDQAIQQTDSGQSMICVDDMYKPMSDISSAFMFSGTCAQTSIDFVQNKQNYKTTKINNDNNEDDNKNNNNNNNNNNDNDNDMNNKNENRDAGDMEKVTNSIPRTGDSSDKDGSSIDLSTGLFAGGVVLTAIVAVAIVVIIRKRNQRAEAVEDVGVQDFPQK